jgi:hypothetical protein
MALSPPNRFCRAEAADHALTHPREPAAHSRQKSRGQRSVFSDLKVLGFVPGPKETISLYMALYGAIMYGYGVSRCIFGIDMRSPAA